MKYLLDTCVISDFIKGEPHTLQHIKNISPSDVAVSTITLMEVQYGLALNPDRANKIRSIIRDFFAPIHLLDFNQDDATQSALVRSLLKQQGTPLGSYDILLAGTALNRKLTLVSSNLNEFNRVDGLQIENWRSR